MEPGDNATCQERFEYWFNRANWLYETRHDPFTDQKEAEWYVEELFKCIKEYQRYYAAKEVDRSETLILADVMFLTYNPRAEVPLKTAHKAVKDFLDKKNITNYIYVIEQRGISEQNMGDFHFHILHYHKYDRASHYKRETQSSFNKTCFSKKWNCLNMKPCRTEQDVTNRLNYILGEKKDIDGLNKHAKQQTDKVFREKYMLKPYYTDNKSLWEKFYDF